jgi:hypothetical protein
MGDARDQFPGREQLWRGAVLATIAQAIWLTSDPALAFTQGWDGNHYLLNDGSGDRAAITFGENYVVAAFFDLHSERSPWRDLPRFPFGSTYRAEDYFVGAPGPVWAIAQCETLQYLLDDYEGSVQPIITGACWSDGDMMTAREPWTTMREHADQRLTFLALPVEEAIAAWVEEYEFLEKQVVLLRDLFVRRLSTASSMLLTARELGELTAYGNTGLAESRELFAAIGILLP